MTRATAVAAATLAALALGTTVAAPALALPELLGQGGRPATLPELLGQAANAQWTGKNTVENLTWETSKGDALTCKAMTDEGVQEDDKSGTYQMNMTGCKSSGFQCNTAGDETGVILWSGTYHDVYAGETETSQAVLFLPEELTAKCTPLVTLKLKGDYLCPFGSPMVASETHAITCSESEGKPDRAVWWNDEDIEVPTELLYSKNGGAFVEAGAQMSGTMTFVGTTVAFMSLSLPEFTGEATAANPTWEPTSGIKVPCSAMSMNGIQESDTAGVFHMDFTGCHGSGVSCHTTGDESGIVLWSGTYHYVFDHLGSGAELTVAVLFLPEELEEKCTLDVFKVMGSYVCPLVDPLTATETHEFTCTQSSGHQSEKTWWDDEGVEEHALLLESFNGGAFLEAGIQMSATMTFPGISVAFMDE